MITKNQLNEFSRKFKINQSVVYREYLQLIFLNEFYRFAGSNKVFFKGGTAIHILLGGPRFSEDLDFTVALPEKKFKALFNQVYNQLAKQEVINIKERKTISGKRFLLTAGAGTLPYATFVNLDFSFREKVVRPQKSILNTPFPILFTSYVFHLSKEELLAEKIRALLTRKKGRDLYDVWFLLTQGAILEKELVKNKAAYYNLGLIGKKDILQRIDSFSEKEFILDVRPFVPLPEREKLSTFFNYIKDYINKSLKD